MYVLLKLSLNSCREFFSKEHAELLILQCDSGDQNKDLIACATYILTDQHSQASERKNQSDDGEDQNPSSDEIELRKFKDMVFLIQLPRVAGGCFIGFQVLCCTMLSTRQ